MFCESSTFECENDIAHPPRIPCPIESCIIIIIILVFLVFSITAFENQRILLEFLLFSKVQLNVKS